MRRSIRRLTVVVGGCWLVACTTPSQVLSLDDCVELWDNVSDRDFVGELAPERPFVLDRIVIDYGAADADNPRNYCVAYYFHEGRGPHYSFSSDGIEDWLPSTYIGETPEGAVQVHP